MTPTPDNLRLCAFLMENPEVPWQWHLVANRFRDDSVDDLWDSPESWTPFDALKNDREIRIHPDYQPPAPKTWEVNLREGINFLAYQDSEGRTCYGLVDSDMESYQDAAKPSFNFWRHGGLFSLHKESGKVTQITQKEV